MKICKILSILPLLFMLSAQTAMAEVMTKEQLFTKHGIVNNSIIPEDFDFETLRKIYASKYGEQQADKLETEIKNDLMLPEIYEGLYAYDGEIPFYYSEHISDLQTVGFDENVTKELGMELTDEMKQELSAGLTEEQFRKIYDDMPYPDLRPLIAKLKDNIYLTGLNGNCGSYGCPVSIAIFKNGSWIYPEVALFFNNCGPVENGNKSVILYYCSIVGGKNVNWRAITADYKPLADVLDRYYDFYKDYVHEYIMR